MKTKITLPFFSAVLFFIVALSSCEEDFNTIGSDIINDDINTEFVDGNTVITYSRKLLPVQTNNLPVYQLGVYNDPVYGKSTVSLLSQVILSESNPSFGFSAKLDSVFLYIPYFSELITTDVDSTYTLDSIYGDSPVKISIYESNYFLRDLDPDTNFEEIQKYYSNQGVIFESFLGELLYSDDEFTPSDEGIVLVSIVDTVEVKETIAPGFRVSLPIEFFREKIINMEGSIELLSNNNFKEYFRGIYFKVESVGPDGNLFIFDIDNANIALSYQYDTLPLSYDDPDNPDNEHLEDSYLLTFEGINVNVYDNEEPQDILDNLLNPDLVNGEETLYVRGGDGIVTVIQLFGDDIDENGVADELEILRDKSWLINEANLIFYVNQNIVTGGSAEPERLIIYDIKNSTFLIDYDMDITSGEEPVNALNVHLGRLERGSDNKGDYYKIRITNHISNLINKDSTNVPLGLIVSQNVLQFGFQDIENIQSPGIEKVPSSSVVSPQGTVLYGNASVNENKRIKLQIYYTETN